MSTVEEFTEQVLSRLMEEHGAPRTTFEYLIPKITIAFDSEHEITPDQMNELIHGDGEGIPPELEELFPLLNAIALSPYTDIDEVDASSQVEKVDEDEDEDDDEDEEDEDDDEDEEDEDDDE